MSSVDDQRRQTEDLGDPRPATFHEYHEGGDGGRVFGVLMDPYNCGTEFIEADRSAFIELEEAR